MASHGGKARDLWVEITSQEGGGGEDEGRQEEQQPKPQIAVVYGRRRNECPIPTDVPASRPGKENRVSFAPSKRTSWNRSLSIRGRESIVVAVGVEFRRPQPKQRGGRKIPRPGPRAKKGVQYPPDLREEKAYFQEVDSFELLEESPSPKTFGTWKMGAQQEIIVHDLPAILERWKISKLAYTCRSSQHLFKILETPVIPSRTSNSNLSHDLDEDDKTPERATRPRVPLNFASCQGTITSRAADYSSTQDSNEDSIITSFNALRIKEEGEGKSCEGLETVIEVNVDKELEGAIREDSLTTRPTSLGGECLSAFAQLLMVCRQSAPISLSEVFSIYCEPSSIVKLGEGTYGEAFKAGETVCKVVPIDGDLLVNGEVQKKSEEVLEEVLLSLTLNSLREQQGETNKQNACTSFIETRDFRVCKGAYDSGLIHAWEDWDAKHGSENDHPKDFSDDQCYIIFVLADGGRDLENFVLLSFDEARSLLVQVTAALAVAEVACEFEHRDLHWGNILLTHKETTVMDFILEGKKMKAKTYGLTISIIDFTLSRINTGEAILFLDLSGDPALFEGPKGDKQSETYRKMKEVTEECWDGSFPKTNVLWLMYVVDILLTKKSFKRTIKDERDLRSFKKRLNSYNSAKDCLSDGFFSGLWVDDLSIAKHIGEKHKIMEESSVQEPYL